MRMTTTENMSPVCIAWREEQRKENDMSEQNCIHKEVCRFFEESKGSLNYTQITTLFGYTISEIHQVIDFAKSRGFKLKEPMELKREPAKPRRKKKRKYKKRGKARKKLTTSKEDIAKVRNLLRMRRVKDLLTEDQIKALDVHAGTHYKYLKETEKQQILDIEKESKNRMEEEE